MEKPLSHLVEQAEIPLKEFEVALEFSKSNHVAASAQEARHEYYSLLPTGTAKERARKARALEQWISLSTTIEEALEAWGETAKKSAEERAALLKMHEIYQRS